MNIQLNLTCLTLYTFIGSLLWGQAARSTYGKDWDLW